eukprot:scaffold88688_cov18-Tisochrysis_lutea.AAC.1
MSARAVELKPRREPASESGMWKPLQPLTFGYEDMAEFEDALHGTFEDFLQAMPHIETKIDEKNRLVSACTNQD